MLMLHQINVYIKDLVAKNKLPAFFLQIFPAEVSQMADAVYKQWDAPLYPEVQKEIAMKLLKLRVQFKEHTHPVVDEDSSSVLNQFKVPFRLAPKNDQSGGTVIILKGDKNLNMDTQLWHGLHGFGAKMLETGLSHDGQKKKL